MHDLTQIAVFQKVVETKGFTAAAHELGITPSAVSRQVSKLEDSLRVQLLLRSTRHIRLTEAGRLFYEKASHGLAAIEEAKEAIADSRKDLNGVLNVSAPPCFGRLHVVPAVPEFLKIHPHITVNVTLGYADTNLFENGIDVLIRSADLKDNNLAFQAIAPMRHVVCATPAYLSAHGVPRTPKDLVHHNCLVLARPFVKSEWRFAGPKGGRRVPVSGNFRADSMEALYAAVMNSLGIARIPNYVIEPDIVSGRLKPIFSDILGTGNRREGPGITMKAYFARSPYPVPKVREFVDFLTQRFRANDRWTRCPTV